MCGAAGSLGAYWRQADPSARDYPQYSPGYYAVFFEDPDGLYLEFAYTPSSGKKMPLRTTKPAAEDQSG